jgi:hypothetical protein
VNPPMNAPPIPSAATQSRHVHGPRRPILISKEPSHFPPPPRMRDSEGMKSCPLCGEAIAGRNAAEVAAEYRRMVVKAKAAESLAEASGHAQSELWMHATWEDRGTDRDSLEWALERLRKDVKDIARNLGDALREYGEVLRS